MVLGVWDHHTGLFAHSFLCLGSFYDSKQVAIKIMQSACLKRVFTGLAHVVNHVGGITIMRLTNDKIIWNDKARMEVNFEQLR